MITLIDYGLGNIKAFENIYKRLSVPVKIAKKKNELLDSSHLILPGVGSFDWAMKRLCNSGMIDELNRLVLEEKRPILGICVGMQMMAKSSKEGKMPGLGWLNGHVNLFSDKISNKDLQLPHMGWNEVIPNDTTDLFSGLESSARFYFLHSYYFSPNKNTNILAKSFYGINFTCAVKYENIFGVQFHPEKSHEWGVKLLKNFSVV